MSACHCSLQCSPGCGIRWLLYPVSHLATPLLVELKQPPRIRQYHEGSAVLQHSRRQRTSRLPTTSHRECHKHDGPDGTQGEIHLKRTARAAPEADTGRQAAEVMASEDHVGRGHGDVATLPAHGDTDGACAQRQRVVDAVTDD